MEPEGELGESPRLQTNMSVATFQARPSNSGIDKNEARNSAFITYKPKHSSTRQRKSKKSKSKPVDDILEMLVLGKRRRGRKESDFKTYQQTTRDKINELQGQIVKAEAQDNIKDVKRFKNMISAYESRLLKRAKVEDIQDQLNVRTAQLQSILMVIRRELDPDLLQRITDVIKAESPKMVRCSTLTDKMEH